MGLGLLKVRFSLSPSIRHTTVGMTPLYGESARRRNLYLTTHNTHKRQTYIPPAGVEPAILEIDRPQTLALDRSTFAIGNGMYYKI